MNIDILTRSLSDFTDGFTQRWPNWMPLHHAVAQQPIKYFTLVNEIRQLQLENVTTTEEWFSLNNNSAINDSNNKWISIYYELRSCPIQTDNKRRKVAHNEIMIIQNVSANDDWNKKWMRWIGAILTYYELLRSGSAKSCGHRHKTQHV